MKTCTKCAQEKSLSDFYRRNDRKSGYTSACKQCRIEKQYAIDRGTPEAIKRSNQRHAEWGKRNLDNLNENSKRWNRKNPDKVNARTAKYRAAKLQATPKWLTDKQKAQIEFFYWLSNTVSKTFGVPHHVDHIHPLLGENLRGLHVPWNLQVLRAKENMSKHNKLR